MRSFPVLLPLLFAARVSFAQSPTTPGPGPGASAPAAATPAGQYQYCQLTRSTAGALELDYGQYGLPPVTDAQLVKAAAQIHATPSLVSALNYLGARGWECISVSTAPAESETPRAVMVAQSPGILGAPKGKVVYRYEASYLLRRRLP